MSDIGAAFADGLRLKWMLGLNEVSKPRHASVAEWLSTGTYGWLPPVGPRSRLDITGVSMAYSEALASEISRFSCAAYESLLDAVNKESPTRSLGWPLVRHYYATFYCAHALLRINGISLTYLSADIANKLNKIGGQYLGISPQLSGGLYLIQRDSVHPQTLLLEKLGNGGGSHEDMWKRFLVFLTDTENAIISSQGTVPAAMNAVRVSTELRAHLCRHGRNDGAWPSSVRNAINYRQDFGVWYPYERSAAAASALTKRMGRWIPADPLAFDIGQGGDDLACFVDLCKVVAQILTAALKDISARSPRASRSFVDLHAFKLLRQRQIEL